MTGYSNYNVYLKEIEPSYKLFAEIPFKMFSNYLYPMLVANKELNSIYLEVFEINELKLKELDLLEKPYEYHRETTKVKEIPNRIEIYVYDHETPPSTFHEIKNGKWDGK
ncbi:MAG: hypothetical protein HeimC3_14580 [Candidatus Heimdallarchaeota archaeon LC_3]|nr:MAG: hypothetical protein HeimC3_14580 [Candidatus Heimdallarchaeota archaeon LC_3]